jgi:hypothetical protein
MSKDNDLESGKLHLGDEDEESSDDDTIEENPLEDRPDNDTDHDDARDVINFPPSYVAPSHRPQNLGNVLAGTAELNEYDIDAIKHRREVLEAEVEQERIKAAEIIEDEGEEAGKPISHASPPVSGPSFSQLQEQAGAIELTTGVLVVDPDEFDKLISPDGESEGLQSSLSSAASTPKAPFSGLKIIDKASDSSNDADSNISTTAVAGTPLSGEELDLPGDAPPTPSPLGRPSSSRRVSFAAHPTVIDTPFTSTVKYLKSLKGDDKSERTEDKSPKANGRPLETESEPRGKENTPYRPRRNAALPEEIAKLKDAGSSDEEDLDQYRDADLAPLDPVMDVSNAGDLILATNSPANHKHEKESDKVKGGVRGLPITPERPFPRRDRSDDWAPRYESPYEQLYRERVGSHNEQMPARRMGGLFDYVTAGEAAAQKELGEIFDKQISTPSKQGAATQEASIDHAMAKLDLKDGGQQDEQNGKNQDDNKKQRVMEPPSIPAYRPEEHPAIINAIGLVPPVVFWGIIGLIVYASNKAYEKVVDQFKGLSIWEKKGTGKKTEQGGATGQSKPVDAADGGARSADVRPRRPTLPLVPSGG